MRAHNTYRSERRNDWRKLNGVTWLEHNRRDHTDEYGVGSEIATYWQSGAIARSKYQPHIGSKERARHAGKPEGAMHVTGHQRLAEWRQWMTTVAAA